MKIRNLIEQSLFLGSGKPSSSRIFSYIMMSIIFLLGLSHVAIEIGNASIKWSIKEVYVPSWQSISIIAMWLAHQLTLLGIYKNAEVKIPGAEKNSETKNAQPINEGESQNI